MLNIVVAVAAGCSGGGPASGAGAEPAAAKEVTGVAASGAPIAQGVVFLKDSSDTPIERQQSTRSDGSFTFNVSDLKPPFILKVTSNSQHLYSIATDSGMTNITPLTTIVVAYAAQRNDLDTLYAAYKPADIRAIAQKMLDSDSAVQAMFAPLMSAFAVKGSLVNGPFIANHTGLDALMDAISVSVASGGITVTQKGNNTLMLNASANQLGGMVVSMSGGISMTPSTPTAGSALYTSKCAGCHGDSANSNLIGRISVLSVQDAIASGLGGMDMLNGLSAADIQAIADHLATSTPVPTPSPAPSTTVPVDGAALFAAKCAGCHGSLSTTGKKGMTAVRLQNAIGGNIGGMGFLSTLSSADIQALVTALNPAVPTPTPAPTPTPTPTPNSDGTALYSANCAGCHGSLASSGKKGISIARLQSAIANNVGGMGYLLTLSVSEVQAVVTVLTPATPTPTPTPTPVVDGPTLYGSYCASCHGALASSGKAGATASRIQTAINNNTGSMGSLSVLSSAQITAIGTALAAVTPAPVPTPTPVVDGPTLYGSYCASCHGALASSAKAGATASRIQTAINNNTGSMGSLSVLSSAQITAVETALATVTPTPAPAPVCGSCHAIPPATGHHSTHKSKGVGCATCHGSGYSSTSFNAATHNNGVKNVATATTGWNASTRTCANSCHGSERW